MKKFMIALATMILVTVTAKAMSYEQARQQALFLADKMAYELNLTEDQYEAVYEINLDYLMGVNNYDDVYGVYWDRRNTDLGYVLLDWQYRAFCEANYFYRPIYWDAGYWHFRVYSRYPRRDYFYFGRPHFWTVYRGGHSWHHNGGHSWYHGRTFGHGGHRPGGGHFGMQDGFKRGDYKHGFDNRHNSSHGGTSMRPGNGGNRPNGNGVRPGNNGNRPNGNGVRPGNNGNRPNGNRGNGVTLHRDNGSNFGTAVPRSTMRESSTRQTVTNTTIQNAVRHSSPSVDRQGSTPSRSFSPSRSSSSSMNRPSGSSMGGSRSMGGHSSSGSRGLGGRR